MSTSNAGRKAWKYTDELAHSMNVVVQPGVNWVDLNNKIKNSGLFLPLDPSPTVSEGEVTSKWTRLMFNRHQSVAWWQLTVGKLTMHL